MSKNLIIVEGPTGAGKSTFIDQAFNNEKGVLTVDSDFQKISKGRFTFDNCAHEKAIENDKLKLKKAFDFLSLDDVHTVLIDRLFFSDWVYETIRNHGRSAQIVVQAKDLQPTHMLEQFAQFVLKQSRELQFYAPFQLELVLVCPSSYCLLEDRRKTKPDKAYPFAHLDWYVYNQFVLAINQYVCRKNTRLSAIYRINDVVLTLIND